MSSDFVWSFNAKGMGRPFVERRYLDGDTSMIEYLDTTLDVGLNPLFEPGRTYAGRAVKSKYVPTKMEWRSTEKLPSDILFHRNIFLVSEKVKDIVEDIDEYVHQFFQIQIYLEGGSLANQMFFFNICTRIDSMDRERTTSDFDGRVWLPGTGEFAFSKKTIGTHNVWIDKHVDPGRFISNSLKKKLEEADVTGLYLEKFPLY